MLHFYKFISLYITGHSQTHSHRNKQEVCLDKNHRIWPNKQYKPNLCIKLNHLDNIYLHLSVESVIFIFPFLRTMWKCFDVCLKNLNRELMPSLIVSSSTEQLWALEKMPSLLHLLHGNC